LVVDIAQLDHAMMPSLFSSVASRDRGISTCIKDGLVGLHIVNTDFELN